MIKSKFITDVVELLLNGNANHATILPQKNLITDTVCGYTSKGLFVTFSHTDDILAYKSADDNLILSGVKITATGCDFQAEASLFFRKGIIDCLEIWSTHGRFPQQDLTDYILTQI